jgi:outer membrane receptor protein involved in Fe transport
MGRTFSEQIQGEFFGAFFGALLFRASFVALIAGALAATPDQAMASEGDDFVPVRVQAERPLSAASDQEIRNKDFMAFPRRTASDLLRFVPGLHITQHTGGAKAHQIFLRGFDAEHGQDVAAFLDGIPLNEVSHVHGVGYLDLHFLLPESVERIWVMKGPYDPRYGNFATAGVIDFVPWTTLDHRAALSLEGGSHERLGALLELSGSWLDERLQSLAFVEADQSEGFTDPGASRALRAFTQHRLRLGRGAELRLIYAGYGVASEASDILPLSLIRDGLVSRFSALDPSNRVDVWRHLLGLRLDWRSDGLKGRCQVYANAKETRIFSNYSFYYFNPTQGDQLAQIDERLYGGLNASVSNFTELGALGLLTELGLQARADEVQQHQARSSARTQTDRLNRYDFTQSSLGVYLDERVDLGEHLRLITGLRLDAVHYDGTGTQDRYGDINVVTNHARFLDDAPFAFEALLWTVSPKASLVFSPTRALSLFVNAGQSFVAPSARQVAWDTERTIPKVSGAELGSTWKGLGERLHVAVSAWWADKDAEAVFDSEVGVTVPRGTSRRLGLDMELRLSPFPRQWPWLWLGTDLYWVRARFMDGARVPNQADWLMTNTLALDHPSGAAATLRGHFVGARHHDLGLRSDASYVVDLQLGYTLTRPGPLHSLALTLAVENLFDSPWYDSAFAYPSRPFKGGEIIEGLHVTPGEPLSATLRLTARY